MYIRYVLLENIVILIVMRIVQLNYNFTVIITTKYSLCTQTLNTQDHTEISYNLKKKL